MPKGTGVSVGIGLAQAVVWHQAVDFEYIPRKSAHPATELERFEAARRHLNEVNANLREKTVRQFGNEEATIFDVYHLMLDDEEALLSPLRHLMVDYHYSAEYSVTLQFDELARQFMRLDDEYMRQRVEDVFNLRDQILRELMGVQEEDHSHLDRPTIIVCRSLSPSDIANLDLSRLEGVVCEAGGYSSHMSIICRTLGVPTVVAVSGIMEEVREGDLVALDGETGEVWISPDAEEIATLHRRGEALAARRAEAQQYRGRTTISTDGRRVELSANVGQLDEVYTALAADAESIGLYRTELLHLEYPNLPTEDEQFEVYRAMLEKMKGKAATVRTFDDGGNRPTIVLKRNREDNPVLGYRGIRMGLGRPSFFRNQLRALLRASAYGSLKVMFPMISTLDELTDALRALESIKEELRREGIPFDEKMPVGVDVEVPAAAILSDAIAQRVDFMSIGINDLVQFTVAIDRGNPDLAYLYHQYHPAVLRLVHMTVEACHRHGIPCVLCGEAPGQEQVLPLMLGLGIDGFSVNPGTLLRCRQILNQCSFAECEALAKEVLKLDSTSDVAARLARLPTF